jgi:hypothetical protein
VGLLTLRFNETQCFSGEQWDCSDDHLNFPESGWWFLPKKVDHLCWKKQGFGRTIGTQSNTCIMKTKLPLFVTVLAAALFGVGCTSITIPDEPINLRAGKARENTSISMQQEGGWRYSTRFSASAKSRDSSIRIKGPSRHSGNGRINANYESSAQLHPKVDSKLIISEIKGATSLYINASGSSGFTPRYPNGHQREIFPLAGLKVNAEKNNGRWDYTSQKGDSSLDDKTRMIFENFWNNTDILPEEAVKAPHTWKKNIDDLFESFRGDGIREAIPRDLSRLEMEFKFVGIKEYKGQNCAVIKISVNEPYNQNHDEIDVIGNFTIKGEIIRSLDSGRILLGYLKGASKGIGQDRDKSRSRR